MKYLTTNKQLSSAYNLISAGYCDLQRALNFASPTAYTTSKMYGWRADVYHFDDFTIVTGYGVPSFAKSIPYELCKQIEKECENKNGDERKEILLTRINNWLKG